MSRLVVGHVRQSFQLVFQTALCVCVTLFVFSPPMFVSSETAAWSVRSLGLHDDAAAAALGRVVGEVDLVLVTVDVEHALLAVQHVLHRVHGHNLDRVTLENGRKMASGRRKW